MKAEKLRGTDAAELQQQVQEAQEQLFRFRFQMGMGQSEGLKKYRSLKKDRARMLTVLREKNVPEPAPVAPVPAASAKGKGNKGKAAKGKAK
jgi:large subunit ribosomal protein L29